MGSKAQVVGRHFFIIVLSSSSLIGAKNFIWASPGGFVISTGALMFATLFKKKDAKSSATSEVVGGRGGG